jgi:hypothetical protein
MMSPDASQAPAWQAFPGIYPPSSALATQAKSAPHTREPLE